MRRASEKVPALLLERLLIPLADEAGHHLGIAGSARALCGYARPNRVARLPCIDFAAAHPHIGGAASAAATARLRGLRDGSGASRRDPAPLFITCMHPGRPITRAAPCQRTGPNTAPLA